MANKTNKRSIDNFGANLRRLRNEKGFTVEEFAWEIEVSPRLVYDYEDGFKRPRLEKAILISEVLGVSLDDMFLWACHFLFEPAVHVALFNHALRYSHEGENDGNKKKNWTTIIFKSCA